MEVNERREETKILIIFSLFLVAFCIISFAFLSIIFTCLFDDEYTKAYDFYTKNKKVLNDIISDKTNLEQPGQVLNMKEISSFKYHESECNFERCNGKYVEIFMKIRSKGIFPVLPQYYEALVYSYDEIPHSSFYDDYKFIKKDNKTWYYKDNSDNKIIIHKINENWYWYEAYF